jgi:hypothetical protein
MNGHLGALKIYVETSHAKGQQDADGGFLKNQVDLSVYRESEIIQLASNFFNYCENHLKDNVRRKNSSFRDQVRHFILVAFRALNRSRIPVIINRYWNCHRTRKLLFKLLDKKRSIISVASIIYISPILQYLNGAFPSN